MKVLFCYILISTILFPRLGLADSVVWSGDIQLNDYLCNHFSKDEIIVHGDVKIINSKDIDPYKSPLVVSIQCDKLTFETGSSLSSMSALDIRISKVTSGPVKLVSLRGVRGGDAKPTLDIWAPLKMKNGPAVGAGPSGNDANCDPFNSHDSTVGGDGPRGNDGENGLNFKASKGANGDPGATASDITLLTASFTPGSSVEVVAIGGDGGSGGRGGRGADGGDAAEGGAGGKGGNACGGANAHSASNGGTGGRGGDGGHGGNGGPGGDGGNGGNGGSVTVGLLETSETLITPEINNAGGIGGDPGLGGERGEGGKKGIGGMGGCSGDGPRWYIGRRTDDYCVMKGADGEAGVPGFDGLLGLEGKDGEPGRIGTGFVGTLPKDIWEKLVRGGT